MLIHLVVVLLSIFSILVWINLSSNKSNQDSNNITTEHEHENENQQLIDFDDFDDFDN